MQRKTKVARISRRSYRCFLLLIGVSVTWTCAMGADKPSPKISSSQEACPRWAEGSTVEDAHDRVSKNGLLELTLKVRSSIDENGNPRYCYIDENRNYSPTLRVQPGDTLVIHLKNEISLPPAPGAHAHVAKTGNQRRNPCDGGEMSAASMNLHFHGLAIPPVCHQDETLKTVIQPGDPAFEYRVRIPKSQPPGTLLVSPACAWIQRRAATGRRVGCADRGRNVARGVASCRTAGASTGDPRREDAGSWGWR